VPVGIILQPTYHVRKGVPIVRLFGRLEEGGAFLVEDDRFRPYFFIPSEDEHARNVVLRRAEAKLEDTDLCDFSGHPVARVTLAVPAEVPPLREAIELVGGRALEADIRFPYRYLIDHGIRTGVEIEGDFESVRPGLVRFLNPKLHPATTRPTLSTLSIDLETTPTASQIFSIALVGCGASEVHLVSAKPVPGCEVHEDEAALLVAAAERIRVLDPDTITGWNVVDFDLRTWQARCDALSLPCELGRVKGAIHFQQDLGFTRSTRASIPGRVVLDGLPLVRDALRLPDYRLETVARTLLGRGKLIDAEVPDSAAEIQRLYREDPAALVAYNREDAQLVLDILDGEGLLDLVVERSLLCGMQLDRVGASIASFDLVFLPELRARGVVAPSVDRERDSAKVQGGALLTPIPGFFTNIAVFDFKSLYPSLIRTFNLDPYAYAQAPQTGHGEHSITAPNRARFARKGAILPDIIERFMERREDAKRRGDRHADKAIKIMMNAMFGVLAATSCRFFNTAVANAITGFGQQMLHWTEEAFSEEGVQAIYGDTDSVFVQLETREPGPAARDEAEALRSLVETRIHSRIRDEYRVEPVLELELEKIYDRFFLPLVRSGAGGSKKRYAGWRNDALEVVGLESVRRDWPTVAARLQRGVLTRVFTDDEVLPFVADLVKDVRAGRLDKELVYTKRIRKGSLDRYTASSPPHIQAARKVKGRVGNVIRYAITSNGPEPVLPGHPLPANLDRGYYIERVLRPIAEAILPHLDLHFEDATGEPRQLSLL